METNDYAIGGRGKAIQFSVDLKETQHASYTLKLQDLRNGRSKAIKQGYEFVMRIKFYGALAKDIDESADYVVISTSTFNAFMELSDAVAELQHTVQGDSGRED